MIIEDGEIPRLSKLQHILHVKFGIDESSSLSRGYYFKRKLQGMYPQLIFSKPTKMNVSEIVFCRGHEAAVADQYQSSTGTSDSLESDDCDHHRWYTKVSL